MNRINLSKIFSHSIPVCFTALCFLTAVPATALAEDKEAAGADAAAGEKTEAPADPLKQPLSGKDGVDMLCEVEIFFTWQRTLPPVEGKPPPSPEAPQEVYFTTVGERGLSVEDIKNRLTSRVQSVRKDALEGCRKTYQDQAQCVATSLRSHSHDYNVMDFKARAALLTAIQQDCAVNTGICLSTRATEPKCYLNRPPDKPAPSATPTPAGEPKKDEKKK